MKINTKKRKRKHGFIKRSSTSSGSKIIKARRRKGRSKIAV